eukprot:scaffold7052_cov254-Pinguiococcus_pyrenoidosus.AAC.17
MTNAMKHMTTPATTGSHTRPSMSSYSPAWPGSAATAVRCRATPARLPFWRLGRTVVGGARRILWSVRVFAVPDAVRALGTFRHLAWETATLGRDTQEASALQPGEPFPSQNSSSPLETSAPGRVRGRRRRERLVQ